MPNKYCCHGDCKSDSRKDKDLRWARFPPKTINPEHAKRWEHLMCRKDFTAETDTRNMFICELHFPENVDLDYHRNEGLETFPHGHKR